MHQKYGDGSKHWVCEKCGYCKNCGDCEKYGCKIKTSENDTKWEMNTKLLK